MKARWIPILVVLSLLVIGGVAYAGGAVKPFLGKVVKGPVINKGTDVISKVAEVTGMTVSDVLKERQAGKSLNQILEAKGKDGKAIVAEAVANFEAGMKKMMDDATVVPARPIGKGQVPAPGGFGLFGDVAKTTGMTLEEVMKERQAGKSLNQILVAKGKDSKAIVAGALSANKTRLDKMVSAGKLAQEKATQLQAEFEVNLNKMLNDQTPLPAPGPHSRGFRAPMPPKTK